MWVMKELPVFRVFWVSDLCIRKGGPVLILRCYHSHLGLLIPLEFYVTLCGDPVYVFPSSKSIILTLSNVQSILSSQIHGAPLYQIMVPLIHGSIFEIFIPFLSVLPILAQTLYCFQYYSSIAHNIWCKSPPFLFFLKVDFVTSNAFINKRFKKKSSQSPKENCTCGRLYFPKIVVPIYISPHTLFLQCDINIPQSTDGVYVPFPSMQSDLRICLNQSCAEVQITGSQNSENDYCCLSSSVLG